MKFEHPLDVALEYELVRLGLRGAVSSKFTSQLGDSAIDSWHDAAIDAATAKSSNISHH